MGATVYRYEFTDAHTRGTVRLDMYAPSAVTLTDAGGEDVVVLEAGAIKEIQEFGWKFDKVQYGMMGAVSGKIVFKMKSFVTSAFKTFLQAYRYTSTTQIYNGTYDSVNQDVLYGNVLRVSYCAYGETDYYTQWYGLQTTCGASYKDATITCEFVDTFQHILKQVKWESITRALWSKVIDDPTARREVQYRGGGVFDWVWSADGITKAGAASKLWGYFGHATQGDPDNWNVGAMSHHTFMTVADFTATLQTCFTKPFSQAIREASPTFNMKDALSRCICGNDGSTVTTVAGLPTDNAELFEQDYSQTPSYGAYLINSNTYVMAFITGTPASVIDALNLTRDPDFSIFDELGRTYQTFWDFFADLFKSAFKVGEISYYNTTPCLNIYAHYPQLGTGTVDITSQLREVEDIMLGENEAVTGQATASTAFAIASDIDNISFTEGAGRNDTTYTIPVIFNTSPVACDYEGYDGSNPDNFRRLNTTVYNGESGYGHLSYNARLLGLYYWDSPTDGSVTENNAFVHDTEMPIRVYSSRCFHDAVNPMAPVASSQTLPAARVDDNADIQSGRSIALFDQQAMGTMYDLARRFDELYWGEYQTLIKGVLPTDYTGHETHKMMCFNLYRKPLQVIVTSIDADETFWTVAPFEYHVTECHLRYPDSLLEVSLWGKG